MSKLLHPDHSVLLVVDIQDQFRAAIPTMADLFHRTGQLLRGADLLSVPVLVTEQYPKGLGHTVTELSNVYPAQTTVLEKTALSAWGATGLPDALARLNRKQVIVCGLEAHACINQTVMDLLEHGYDVYLVEDAVGSRKEADRQVALKKLVGQGAIPVCTEMVLFEWLRDARHPHFKAIQQIVLS